MRIGLYGMPTSGKTFILDRVDFIKVMQGSRMLHELCPDFDTVDENKKNIVRQELANLLAKEDKMIMDGHYAFGNKVVFTEADGRLYDAILYLYISPEVLKSRMELSERNRKYLTYDIEAWQNMEIEELRGYCHKNNKDFYVIDNPPSNTFNDVSEVLGFIRAIVDGYSCKEMADRCVNEILMDSHSDTVVLMDGDKTITTEDTSHAVFGYTTHLYDGNFYTGYQSWKQAKEFESYDFEDLTEMPVPINEKVIQAMTDDTYILTSGHERVWRYIAERLDVSFYSGIEMAAETKLFITKFLQEAGKKVIAYGDGMNDYYMLMYADKGYLVTKKDGSVSRSLRKRSLEGLIRV